MRLIARKSLPNATLISDRFHAQRLINEAVNDLRIDFRRQSTDLENKKTALAGEVGHKYIPAIFEHGDTRRQLPARSRHIVMKHFSRWTPDQRKQAEILFREYPAVEEAYQIYMNLTRIYSSTSDKSTGITRIARWYDKGEKLNLKFFKCVIETVQNNLPDHS
jgi:transposase